MAHITITEALAELKTIDKRIEKKREFVLGCLEQVGLKSAGAEIHSKAAAGHLVELRIVIEVTHRAACGEIAQH